MKCDFSMKEMKILQGYLDDAIRSEWPCFYVLLPEQIGVTTANSVVVPDIKIMYYIGVEISVVRCINRALSSQGSKNLARRTKEWKKYSGIVDISHLWQFFVLLGGHWHIRL